MKKVLALWTMAEDRNQKLERKIMIDGVLHKITVVGLVAGALLFAIIAL
jgi:membrane protein involved in colicin uptake